MLRTRIRKIIEKAIRARFGIHYALPFSVYVPDTNTHGDYSTNAAFLVSQYAKKLPADCAQKLAEEMKKDAMFAHVEATSAGFCNIQLSDDMLRKELSVILAAGDAYGNLRPLHRAPRTIDIEFISANPTGPLTLGNGRGAFIGDALANILSRAGCRVTREYYINDARASAQICELGKTIAGKGKEYKGAYTDEIQRRLKERFADMQKLSFEDLGFAAAQEIQKDNKEFIRKKLRIRFDVWYSEEKLYKKRHIARTLEELGARNATYGKDGATWFRSSAFGDSEDRVAVRQDGAPTYFLPDVAYHKEKFVERGFDTVIDILGADHHGTFPRVSAGLKALGIDPLRVRALFTQIVRWKKGGKEVKMSKRKGLFVTLEELVDDVSLDAARYFFLEKSPDTHMDFESERAKEQSVKNPVYYIQYAHARIESIFRKIQ
ncbi:MAG: arginine--tRNA ligase, partial [Candidatus Colwellbacteria bacterium]|nr:arginine--tRNA ligase [Candidatus Colwellbacteria bacterium]